MSGLGDRAKEVAIEHVKQKAARDILNGIKDWRSASILTAKRRWLFELIQNAVDTAKAKQNEILKIEIDKNENSVSFKHDGGYFTLDEISAVIYGGSTKPYAPESEYIGKFGIGFLVTHIVSRRVRISGVVKENDGKIYGFQMEVNRESNEEKGISQSIEECFQQLNTSQPLDSRKRDLYTEFVFYLNDELGKDAVEVGINELKRNLPFVFAFNEIIQEITINGEKFTKQNEKFELSNGIMVTNVYSPKSKLPTVFIRKDDDKKIVVGIAVNGKEIMESEKLPKIYVGMPLIETADYVNIPFITNSAFFKPTKERNALSSSKESIFPSEYEINKELLSKSFEVYKELLAEISKIENIKGLFRTINIQLISEEKISQNPLWKDLNEYIENTFTQIIEEIPLVETSEGRKEVKNAIFPINKIKDESLDKELFRKFYRLTSKIKKNIPAFQEELENWVSVVDGLKRIGTFAKYISLFGVADMQGDFVRFVKQKEKYPKFKDINEKFCIEDSKQFLLSFLEIVEEIYKRKIISLEFVDYLLPDQSGTVGPREWDGVQLYIDEGISDDFKDIAHKIGWEIRKELLDNDFVKYEIIKDFVRDIKNIDNALDKLIKSDNFKPNEDKIRKNEWDEKIQGWIELLRWCVIHEKLINGFPVIVKEKRIKNIGKLDEESFIIPFRCINIDEKYEEIFPDSRIMHSKYFEVENSQNLIELLKNYKLFVTTLPLYKNILTLGFNKLESILKGVAKQLSKVEHSISAEETSFSFIPFLEQEVEGRVSQIQERGKLLFNFAIEYLINSDCSWEKSVQVNCTCKDKTHEIIPSQWLASMKSDAWVPHKTKENEEERIVKREATKESIENLLSSEELNELIKNNPEKITKFLPHFGFDELELKIKLRSIETGKLEDVIRREVTGFVDIADTVPDLPEIVKHHLAEFREAIEKLRERLERAPIKDENRKIGKNLEKIVEKIFRDKGFTVEPIYVGGDLELWPEDVEGWDSGLIEINPYLMEVKFTSGNRVHLSKKQAEMARNKQEDYIVLVVENAGNLRENLIQMDINSISDDIISDVIANSHVIVGIHNKLGEIPNPEEIELDINGYWVKKKLWMSDKNDITTWIDQKFGDGV